MLGLMEVACMCFCWFHYISFLLIGKSRGCFHDSSFTLCWLVYIYLSIYTSIYIYIYFFFWHVEEVDFEDVQIDAIETICITEEFF